MGSFPLKIATPNGVAFDGPAARLIVRTVEGDMAVLPRHIGCVSLLGTGPATVEANGRRRTAQCSGGFLTVADSGATLIAHTFRWEDP